MHLQLRTKGPTLYINMHQVQLPQLLDINMFLCVRPYECHFAFISLPLRQLHVCQQSQQLVCNKMMMVMMMMMSELQKKSFPISSSVHGVFFFYYC